MSQKRERFESYLQSYEKLVVANAGNYVDDQLAEDVAQDTFLKMYEHLDYLEDDKIKSWLIVVSGNIAKDYLKRGGKNKAEVMDPIDLEIQMEERFQSAEECFEKDEKRKAALKLLRTACSLLFDKNPIWYYIMIDSCMLGMTSAQIGKVLDLKPGTVDVMKNRARSYLKKKLGKEFRDYF